jgi:hypothetical protein
MRFLTLLTAAALLTACATATPSAPGSPTAAPGDPPAASSSRAARLLAAAGANDAPTQGEVERALGPADISRRDGAGAALTYRLDSCALLLLFSADARNEMRLAEASASARRAGAAAPTLEQCAMEASARRS